jgi:hypothetical protein
MSELPTNKNMSMGAEEYLFLGAATLQKSVKTVTD